MTILGVDLEETDARGVLVFVEVSGGGGVGPAGPQGPAGPTGPAGADGADGAPGPSAVSTDAGNLLTLGTDSLILLDPADLPAGGGGVGLPPTGAKVSVVSGGVEQSTMNGGRFNYSPVYLPDCTIASLSVLYVSGAASNIFGALYSTDTVGGDGTLAHALGSFVGDSGTGEKTFVGPWTIAAGIYYLGVLSPDDQNIIAMNGSACVPGLGTPLVIPPNWTLGGRYIWGSGLSALPATLTGAGSLIGANGSIAAPAFVAVMG